MFILPSACARRVDWSYGLAILPACDVELQLPLACAQVPSGRRDVTSLWCGQAFMCQHGLLHLGERKGWRLRCLALLFASDGPLWLGGERCLCGYASAACEKASQVDLTRQRCSQHAAWDVQYCSAASNSCENASGITRLICCPACGVGCFLTTNCACDKRRVDLRVCLVASMRRGASAAISACENAKWTHELQSISL